MLPEGGCNLTNLPVPASDDLHGEQERGNHHYNHKIRQISLRLKAENSSYFTVHLKEDSSNHKGRRHGPNAQ